MSGVATSARAATGEVGAVGRRAGIPAHLWPERALALPCAAWALGGGLVLVAVMLVSVASIVARSLFGSPILGDFELVERGCAITVFAVLPYCHLKGGHVVIDMFLGMMRSGARRWLTLLAELVFAGIAGLLTWRMTLGAIDLAAYDDSSMMLQIPTWWVFVPIVASAGLLTLVCLARAAAAAGHEDNPRPMMTLLPALAIAAAAALLITAIDPEALADTAKAAGLTGTTLATASFAGLVALLVIGIPVGTALLVIGGVGYVLVSGLPQLLNYMSTAPYYQTATYSLSVIPLFVLMGQFATASGLSRGIFNAANAWLGHRPGGIAMAGVGACAAFGAICGSSLATAATMAHVSMPEMRRFKYSGALSTGALAAGGTLGILIPPSVILVIYAILTEQSIGKLFLAAILPGALAALGYMIAIAVYVHFNPDAGPAAEKPPFAARLKALGELAPVAIVFVVVMGGIYGGFFTPTEGAAVGAAATGVIAVVQGGLRWKGMVESLLGAAKLTGMIFLILIGADLFNAYLALTQMPAQAAAAISDSGLPPMLVLALILLFYLALGCVMDSMSMVLITVPVLFPIVMGLDFGMSAEHTAIWFGILVLIVVEVGLITPPFGLNVFVINSVAPDVPLTDSFRGVLPFLASDAIRVLLLAAFPVLTVGLLPLLE